MKSFAALTALLLIPVLGFAQAKPLYTIYTGSQKGTYFKIAEDIVKACPAFEINIEQSQGSLQNINALITAPVVKNGYRIAMVQEDALAAIIGSEPKAKSVYKDVMPLYAEEITVIVNNKAGIKTIKDLQGKKVAGGLPGSGIWFTSNVIRTALNIRWLQVDKSPEESVLLVLTGELDAMVVVGGVPLRLFQELSKPMSERITMIPITATELEKIYVSSRVPASTYLWQDYPVDTKATKSLMIAAADVPDRAIKELQTCLAQNLSSIQKFGHPKWKEISKNKLINQSPSQRPNQQSPSKK